MSPRRPLALVATLAAAALFASPGATGQFAKRGFEVEAEIVAQNLGLPMYTAVAPGVDNLVYVVQRAGTVRALDPSDGSSVEYLDLSNRVSTEGEGGLLSIAFDPAYQQNGKLYAYYTTNDSHRIQIDELTAPSDTEADESSRRRVLAIPHPGAQNHQGGTIAFGGDDRLYAAPGDGGGSGDPKENAQNRKVLLGKVLRINPHGAGPGDYKVPKGNPFVGRKGRNEIYAMGLRNPFRFSFDPPTGRIAIGDVGQGRWEEVDIESRRTLRNANFGWDHYEGAHRFDAAGDNEAPKPPRRTYEPPVHEYSHAQGNVITGGIVVRDSDLPELKRRYLYADFSSDELRSFKVKLSGARNDRPLGLSINSPTSFASGPDGTVYVTSFGGTGRLLRLIPATG